MLHLVHLRPHYFVRSVITIMRINLGCPVLKKQLYCPSFLWVNAQILEETHSLFYHRGCNGSSTLFCVGSGSTQLCNMNHCSNSCLQFLFTLKQWFSLGVCTLQCDLLTVQELCKRGCYLLRPIFSLLPIFICLLLVKYRKEITSSFYFPWGLNT